MCWFPDDPFRGAKYAELAHSKCTKERSRCIDGFRPGSKPLRFRLGAFPRRACLRAAGSTTATAPRMGNGNEAGFSIADQIHRESDFCTAQETQGQAEQARFLSWVVCTKRPPPDFTLDPAHDGSREERWRQIDGHGVRRGRIGCADARCVRIRGKRGVSTGGHWHDSHSGLSIEHAGPSGSSRSSSRGTVNESFTVGGGGIGIHPFGLQMSKSSGS